MLKKCRVCQCEIYPHSEIDECNECQWTLSAIANESMYQTECGCSIKGQFLFDLYCAVSGGLFHQTQEETNHA